MSDVLPRVVLTIEGVRAYLRAVDKMAKRLQQQGVDLSAVGTEVGEIRDAELVVVVPIKDRAPWEFTIPSGEWRWTQ